MKAGSHNTSEQFGSAGLLTHNDNTSPTGLTIENFSRVGARGIGDQRNSYSQSMSWFKGKLYVGTARDTLCLIKRANRTIPPPIMEFWPVKCPDPEVPQLMRGQILAYDPGENRWEMVYKSPMVASEKQARTTGNTSVMRDVGYRGMEIYQGHSDSEPCLYAGSISATGARILRSRDGINFQTSPIPLLGPSIRSLLSYKGRLYTAIIGKVGGHANVSDRTELWESEDPFSGNWRPVSKPSFGDPGNVALFELAEFNGYLYVATMNSHSGFQLWKTDAEGSAPYRWKKVITAGAYRGFLNEYAISLCAFDGCLYIGTGISGGGYDRVNSVGPAAAELLRVYADDTWDLVVGSSRITPDGAKIPISGLGPGFDNFMNGYIWRMCSHDGWLYAGTFNSSVFISYRPHFLQDVDRDKIHSFARYLPTGNLEEFIEHYGGCHLWRTKDGERFYPVTRNGFGTPYNIGIRQMRSTLVGLFVGTANPFGPLVGVKKNGKWVYEPNPRGGTEIWLGSPPMKVQKVQSSISGAKDKQYRRALLKVGRKLERLPFYIMTDDFYDNAGFHHVGYWRENTTNGREACEAIIDTLMTLDIHAQGQTLDVACGKGGTTRYLLNYFPAGQLIGIDELQWAVDCCRENIPTVRFLTMDPARLEFPDETFMNIICVEEVPYFTTRYDFLKESVRVLKPGGRLVLADILFSRDAVKANRGRYRTNYVKDLNSYRKLLSRAGFEANPEIMDLTGYTILPYTESLSEYMREKYVSKQISEGKFNAVMAFVSRMVLFATHYIVVLATKRPD